MEKVILHFWSLHWNLLIFMKTTTEADIRTDTVSENWPASHCPDSPVFRRQDPLKETEKKIYIASLQRITLWFIEQSQELKTCEKY